MILVAEDQGIRASRLSCRWIICSASGGIYLHEAIAMVAWEGKPEGTVLAENRKGYLLNGRLLRPAQVTVAQSQRPADGGAFEEGNGPERNGRES